VPKLKGNKLSLPKPPLSNGLVCPCTFCKQNSDLILPNYKNPDNGCPQDAFFLYNLSKNIFQNNKNL